MQLDQNSPFAQAILDHLELKRRNAGLEYEMPLARYLRRDPNEPRRLRNVDENGQSENTITGVLWPDAAA